MPEVSAPRAIAPNPQAQERLGHAQWGAELFASIPHSFFFMFMFHVIFLIPPNPNARRSPTIPTSGPRIPGEDGAAMRSTLREGSVTNPHAPMVHQPLWQLGEPIDLFVFLSTSNETRPPKSPKSEISAAAEPQRAISDQPTDSFLPGAIEINGSILLWHERELIFDHRAGNDRTFQANFTADDLPSPWQNGSVFAHVFLARRGATPQLDLGGPDVAYAVLNLVSFRPRTKARKAVNLISGELADRDRLILEQNARHNVTEERENEIIPLWKPELAVNLVDEATPFPHGALPKQMLDNMKFDADGNYFPVVHLNDFWLTREQMLPVNRSLEALPLKLTFSLTGRFKWLMVVQWQDSLRSQQALGTSTEHDEDQMKRMLLESDPVLLGVTMCVSILHTVFDILAFKNDISFWRKIENMQGLSIRSIFTSIITQSIIFLYLVDNDTSYLILFSSGVGLLIEIWKVQKAMNVVPHTYSLLGGRLPIRLFRLEHKKSYSSQTLQYDQLAMRYLTFVLYPLCIGFSIYSLMYNHYKSWWSWLLSSAVGCVYTFGFIMMTPQLFINYKLKSVAHLPWRAMVYKFLNTIIDDLFAFVIRMPTLHRLSVFRDDLIFIIYLYQRWAYRVDHRRPNEFGFVAKDPAADAASVAPNEISPPAAASVDTTSAPTTQTAAVGALPAVVGSAAATADGAAALAGT